MNTVASSSPDIRPWGPKFWETCNSELRSIPAEERERLLNDNEAFARMAMLYLGWEHSGRIVYELSHSVAAMFALTSAPPIQWNRAPHTTFAVKIPREFGGADFLDDSWILVGKPDDGLQYWMMQWILPLGKRTAIQSLFADDLSSDDLENISTTAAAYGWDKEEIGRRRLAHRYLANTIAYVTRHRECVSGKGVSNTGTLRRASVYTVGMPRDVVVSRGFRDSARALVAATDMVGVRRALAHHVRGHWRNQACGEGRAERKMTWVQPHKRGDESLGSVVQRIEKISGLGG